MPIVLCIICMRLFVCAPGLASRIQGMSSIYFINNYVQIHNIIVFPGKKRLNINFAVKQIKWNKFMHKNELRGNKYDTIISTILICHINNRGIRKISL